MKKKLQIIIPLLLAGAAVFAERYYLHEVQRPMFVRDASEQMSLKLGQFQAGIKEKIQEGFFHKYLILESISSDQIAALFEVHPMARGVTVFNPDLHIMSATNPEYPLSRVVGVLEKVRKERRETFMVTDKGIEVFFPILWGDEPEGFVSVLYPVFGGHDETIAFICSLTREELYLGSQKSLSFGERELFKEKLRMTQMQSKNHAVLKLEKSYDIYWQYDPALRLYYGQITLAAPFWSYISFYISLFTACALLVLLISRRPQRQEDLDSLEASLQKNRETLAHLAQNLNQISRLPDHTNTLTPEKVIERADSELPESSRPERVYEPGGYTEHPRAMDFVLFDPLEKNWQTIFPAEPKELEEEEPLFEKTPLVEPPPAEEEPPFTEEEPALIEEGLDEKTAELRKRAFSSELLELMDEVTHPEEIQDQERAAEIEDLSEAAALFHEELQGLSINPYGESLKELYSGELDMKDMEAVLEHIRKRMHAGGLLLVVFDKEQGCYVPCAAAGLESSWKENFFLLHNDNVIPFDPIGAQLLKVDAEKKEEPFFQKRFLPEHLDDLESLYIFPMHSYRVRSALVGVYLSSSSQEVQVDDAVNVTKIEQYLKELAPAVSQLEEKIGGYHAQEHFKTVISELKGVIATGFPETTVIHAEPIIPIDLAAYEKIEKLCVPMLSHGERLILVHPAHFVILLKRAFKKESEERNRQFVEAVQSVTEDVTWRVLEYPENGKNLFSYF